MIPYSGQDGCVGPSGQWVWWQRMKVMVMMIVMVLASGGKCSTDGPPAKAEDCVVFHMERKDSSSVVPFQETVTFGFQPRKDGDVLAGLTFRIATDEGYTTLYFRSMVANASKRAYCSQDGSRLTIPGKEILVSDFSYKEPFLWNHINFSLINGVLSLNNIQNICPSVLQPGGNSSFMVKRSEYATDIVFNCQTGCPIYPDSALFKYDPWVPLGEKAFYMKTVKEDASASVVWSFCKLNQTNRICQNFNKFNLTSLSGIDTWEKISVDVTSGQNSLDKAELKLGDNIIRTVQKTTSHPVPFLYFESSEGIHWAIGCDPRHEETKGLTSTSTSEPTEGHTTNAHTCQKCLENYDQPQNELVWKILFISLLVINILALIIFIVRKRLLTKARGRVLPTTKNPNLPQNSENSVGFVNPAVAHSQGSSPSGIIVESGSKRLSDVSATLPNSSASPSAPVNVSRAQDDEYDDPRELLKPRRSLIKNGSSNNPDLASALPQTPSPNDEGNPTAEPPEGGGDDEENDYCYIDHEVLMEQLRRDREEKEVRKMREAENGDGLTRHESVNSLYEEVKRMELGQ